MIIKNIVRFFDKLENKIKGKLSRHPILYALVGGVGVILFWRGVWHIADDINVTSGASFVIGSVILLVTGIFVSEFIGKKLIISDLGGEKKLTEKEEGEIKTEEAKITNLESALNRVEKKLDHMETHLEK